MHGTIIRNLSVLKVSDGDTLQVDLNGTRTTLRLALLDTEEVRNVSPTKPKTNAGRLASLWAKDFFNTDENGIPHESTLVDIEFDTNHSVEECLIRHRGNYGRLLCYVHKDGVHYNLEAIKTGWSPHFVKYGRSRLYHEEFLKAEAHAQAHRQGVWDPSINADGPTRPYDVLLPWWALRDSQVQEHRRSESPTLSVRLDYEKILSAAENNKKIEVLCDLQNPPQNKPSGALLPCGGKEIKQFFLWIPERSSPEGTLLLQLLSTRYTGHKRNYVIASGNAILYRDMPEIVLTDITQLSDPVGPQPVIDTPSRLDTPTMIPAI